MKTINTNKVYVVENCGCPVCPTVLFYSKKDAKAYLKEEGYEPDEIREMDIIPLIDSLDSLCY